MCWIRCQDFLLYISGLENSPSGDETTFDFMVRMFTGDKDCRLVGSLRPSTVRGLEFKMPSTSVIIANKDSSSRHSPYFFKSDPRMAYLHKHFLQFSFCTNEITSIVWVDSSDISSPCNQRATIKESVSKKQVTSMCTALLAMHVNMYDISSQCSFFVSL